MYADRYSPKPVNRGSLTLSIGIVGALVAAAMLSNTVIHHDIVDRPLETFPVAPEPPPPPPEPQPKPQPRTDARMEQVVRQDPVVPTKLEAETFATTAEPLPPPPLPGTGISDVVLPVDPPKPPPVLTGAQPDARVDFQPVYPAEERRAGREGVVTLRVLIGTDGRVREVERVAAASDAFWRVTEQRALTKWRFKPATRDGAAYESWKTMTVRFRLEEG